MFNIRVHIVYAKYNEDEGYIATHCFTDEEKARKEVANKRMCDISSYYTTKFVLVEV